MKFRSTATRLFVGLSEHKILASFCSLGSGRKILVWPRIEDQSIRDALSVYPARSQIDVTIVSSGTYSIVTGLKLPSGETVGDFGGSGTSD